MISDSTISKSNILHIKNMVCNRCIMAVEQVLDKAGLEAERVSLGKVVLKAEPDSDQLTQLDKTLLALGFERIDDKKSRLIEAIKNKVIWWIHYTNRSVRKHNWSDLLADELHHDYNYLSSLFSSVEGVTLEQYIIRQKIERAKELLFYDELTLSEIADQLGYSSVAHLSAQFKKVTGLTPSALRRQHSGNARKPLDEIL
ncbi:MAG: helix-turn-helix transcriptional regulator [Cyclobacteriaceae bacterium]|nr:helix-turn-helix transcriptional regulator [Cyclobacteriaceae bacterium]